MVTSNGFFAFERSQAKKIHNFFSLLFERTNTDSLSDSNSQVSFVARTTTYFNENGYRYLTISMELTKNVDTNVQLKNSNRTS